MLKFNIGTLIWMTWPYCLILFNILYTLKRSYDLLIVPDFNIGTLLLMLWSCCLVWVQYLVHCLCFSELHFEHPKHFASVLTSAKGLSLVSYFIWPHVLCAITTIIRESLMWNAWVGIGLAGHCAYLLARPVGCARHLWFRRVFKWQTCVPFCKVKIKNKNNYYMIVSVHNTFDLDISTTYEDL